MELRQAIGDASEQGSAQYLRAETIDEIEAEVKRWLVKHDEEIVNELLRRLTTIPETVVPEIHRLRVVEWAVGEFIAKKENSLCTCADAGKIINADCWVHGSVHETNAQKIVREKGFCGGLVPDNRICIKEPGHSGNCGEPINHEGIATLRKEVLAEQRERNRRRDESIKE